jgi:hypothetical protein
MSETTQNYRDVYQIVDGSDLFTHGIFDNLDYAKNAARSLYERDQKYFNIVQINRIPLNVIGAYSEEMNPIWSLQNGDEIEE